MATNKLKKNLPLMKVLESKLKNKKKIEEFHSLIECLGDKSLEFLAECVQNGINPDFVSKLPTKEKTAYLKKITPFKKDIKKVIKKTTSSKKKRKIIQKGSGWFLPILSSVIPLISDLIFNK
jgi:hypothetical protein